MKKLERNFYSRETFAEKTILCRLSKVHVNFASTILCRLSKVHVNWNRTCVSLGNVDVAGTLIGFTSFSW